MKRSVIADTGPLYAAADPADAHHKKARSQLLQLAREKRDVIVSYPTLFEAYSLILFRLGLNFARGWLKEMELAALVIPTSEDCRRSALTIQSLGDQPITLFDGIVASLSTRLNVPVWTYDHHFDLMRIEVWR